MSERHRFAILEDDLDAEYAFHEAPELPLAAEDKGRRVIQVACLSRILAPGLRLGFVVASADLVDRLARLQRSLEWQGDRVLEWAVAELIRDGDLTRQLRRTRIVYRDRMQHLVGRLRERFGDDLDLDPPRGGLALWIRPRFSVSLEVWVQAARLRGLVLHGPGQFSRQGKDTGVRLGFAQHEVGALDVAVQRLEAARRDVEGGTAPHADHCQVESSPWCE